MRHFFFILFLLVGYQNLISQNQEERPRIAAWITEGAVSSDGLLDEAAWEQASVMEDFQTVVPVQMGTPTKTTRVRILAHERFLVVGIECQDDPDLITNFSKLRDTDLENEDYIKVIIDPFLDGQSGYIFSVNPNVALYDDFSNRLQRSTTLLLIKIRYNFRV